MCCMHVYVGTQFVTIPVSILDAVFLPVSKLERFRSKIVTVPIWDVQFRNWMWYYVDNVWDMSPECLRDTTMSPILGDIQMSRDIWPIQSLIIGLSHVSGPSVITLQ